VEREERTATQGCNRNVDVLLIILTVSDRLVVRLQPNVSLRSTRGGVIGRQRQCPLHHLQCWKGKFYPGLEPGWKLAKKNSILHIILVVHTIISTHFI